MIKLLFGVLEQGLKLWNTKESRKYLDQMIELKRAWYEEFNKSNPSDAVLDNIERELRIIGEAFASQIGAENTENKS